MTVVNPNVREDPKFDYRNPKLRPFDYRNPKLRPIVRLIKWTPGSLMLSWVKVKVKMHQ